MIGINLVFVAAFLGGISAQCTSNGSRIINPYNCHQYYECVNGTQELHSCSSGMYFNCWDETCEKRLTYGCYNNCLPPNCPKSGDKIPDNFSNNCTLYLQCNNIKHAVVKSCSSGEKFDQWKRACVPENEASCTHVSQSYCGVNSKNCTTKVPVKLFKTG